MNRADWTTTDWAAIDLRERRLKRLTWIEIHCGLQCSYYQIGCVRFQPFLFSFWGVVNEWFRSSCREEFLLTSFSVTHQRAQSNPVKNDCEPPVGDLARRSGCSWWWVFGARRWRWRRLTLSVEWSRGGRGGRWQTASLRLRECRLKNKRFFWGFYETWTRFWANYLIFKNWETKSVRNPIVRKKRKGAAIWHSNCVSFFENWTRL